MPVELKNALSEWNTVLKPLPSVGGGWSRTSHPLCRVEIFLKPALAKNLSVVRDFQKDISDLQELLTQFTKVLADAKQSWTRQQANEQDPKKKAVLEKIFDCLHGILEALARRIEEDNHLRGDLNKALANIVKVGGLLAGAPDYKDAIKKEKDLTEAIKKYDSLTTKSTSWNGPTPKYLPKDGRPVVLADLEKLTKQFVLFHLKGQANYVDKGRNDLRGLLKKIHMY